MAIKMASYYLLILVFSFGEGAFAACALVYVNDLPLMDKFDGGIRTSLGVNGSGILWTTFPDPDVPTGILVLDTVRTTITHLR